MRLNVKFFYVSFLALAGVFTWTSCSQDDDVKPNADGNLPLEERAPANTALIALTEDNQLLSLMSGPPATETGSVPITGLRVEETIRAIDTRPRTGELFGLSNLSIIYKIDKGTGVATAVSGQPLVPAPAGSVTAFDISPVDDMIRIVTDGGQNMRVNPNTGAVQVIDVPFAVNNPVVNSAAYQPPVRGNSTYYAIDISTGNFYRSTNPSAGVLSLAGVTGFTWSGEGGFDISPYTGHGWAVQYGNSRTPTGNGSIFGGLEDNTDPTWRLYNINLRNGYTYSHGKVRPVIGLTVR